MLDDTLVSAVDWTTLLLVVDTISRSRTEG